MGWTDWLFGGTGQDPSHYKQQFQDRSNILQASNQGMNDAYGRAAPQLQMGQDPFRNSQLAQLQQLQRIASGQQQGAGELATQRAAQQGVAQQQGMAAMQRGQGAGMGALAAARGIQNITGNAAGQSQQAALQDQANAQGMMSGIANAGRGQDIGVAGQNANLQQQQYGQNDQAINAYLSQISGMDQAQLQAQMQGYGANANNPGLFGGLLSAGGQIGAGLAMHSDERSKTAIADADDDVDEMLSKLLPKAYVYKDQSAHGAGRRVGIMAQDLERSKAGAAMVTDTPDGKVIDVLKAISASLAAAARLHQRVHKLEGGK